jgi:hypothetical protein
MHKRNANRLRFCWRNEDDYIEPEKVIAARGWS